MAPKSIHLSHSSKLIHGEVQLTGSKSESNRALIIQALSNGKVTINNLSEAADTVTLKNVLADADGYTDGELTIDIGPAGTAMRFMSAYLCLKKGSFLLTGSKRMKERPIGILAEALQSL